MGLGYIRSLGFGTTAVEEEDTASGLVGCSIFEIAGMEGFAGYEDVMEFLTASSTLCREMYLSHAVHGKMYMGVSKNRGP